MLASNTPKHITFIYINNVPIIFKFKYMRKHIFQDECVRCGARLEEEVLVDVVDVGLVLAEDERLRARGRVVGLVKGLVEENGLVLAEDERLRAGQ